MENLQIGTNGWQMPEGTGGFYPEDMPVEWQLVYYSNAFRVVLVPEPQWMAWDEVALEECVDSVEGEFGFYLRVDGELSEDKVQSVEKVLNGLGERLQGILVFSDKSVPAALVHGLPVSLLSTVGAEALSLPGWSGQVGGYQISGKPVGYCDDLSADGKQQAALLRGFMQQVPENSLGVVFFIGGDSINMNHIANLKMVGEFLGY